MICPRCGGRISINKNCSKCHIPYSDLITTIRHDEMKNLFLKIEDLILNRKSIRIEESLLACELLNSSLLIPLRIDENDNLEIKSAEFEGKNYILLFTDIEEYEKIIKDISPMTNPFRYMLDLLDDNVEGFIINFAGEGCELSRKYLSHYF